jgi:RNA polymerase sigma-70 factor (ECF subfamily)
MDTHHLSDPEHWVDEHGDYLYRYALFRLHDAQLAEDMVQETFLAALHAQERFSGRSSEKTWLVGILKHKIADHIRKVSRERSFGDTESSIDIEEDLFDEAGKWKIAPTAWDTDPSSTLENKEFWEVLKRCLSDLPDRLSDAFSLREMDGLSTKEICKLLNVSATNLWVMLHRARMRLRRCLELNWFEHTEGAL